MCAEREEPRKPLGAHVKVPRLTQKQPPTHPHHLSLSSLARQGLGKVTKAQVIPAGGAFQTKAQIKSAGRQSEASGCHSPPEQTKALPFSGAALSGLVSMLCNSMPPGTLWQLSFPCQSWLLMAHFSEPYPSPAPNPHKGGGTKRVNC